MPWKHASSLLRPWKHASSLFFITATVDWRGWCLHVASLILQNRRFWRVWRMRQHMFIGYPRTDKQILPDSRYTYSVSFSRTALIHREFIDYKTSMIRDEDPLRGLLFYKDLGFSHTLHVLKTGTGKGCGGWERPRRPSPTPPFPYLSNSEASESCPYRARSYVRICINLHLWLGVVAGTGKGCGGWARSRRFLSEGGYV